jgi:hypothetical protein
MFVGPPLLSGAARFIWQKANLARAYFCGAQIGQCSGDRKGYKLAELRVCGSGGKAGIDRCRWLENPKVIGGTQLTTAMIREGDEFGTCNRAGAVGRHPGG